MNNRVRACFVSLMFSPKIGGAEARAERQARQLRALGHDVTVITLRLNKQWKRMELLDGLPVLRIGGIYKRGGQLRIGRLGIWPINIAMLLKLWFLRKRYDVIHVFQVSPLAAVAALISKITHTPVIISSMNSGPDETQRMQLERDGAKLMADTLAESPFLTVELKDWAPSASDIAFLPRSAFGGNVILNVLRKSNAYFQILSSRNRACLISNGVRADHIVCISGSVNTEQFRPALERGRSVQTALAARLERDIICVARLEFSKGVDVLLHAWGRMMNAPAEWRLHLKPRLRIVGDGVFRRQLEYIAGRLKLSESVEFLGSRTDIVHLLQQSWAFVMPSRWEGMPNALLEAMACGLPCIATRVSGSEDLIVDGINGMLVEPEQPIAMGQALRRLLQDSELALQLGHAARAAVVRDYQLSSVVDQCLELYRQLLAKSKTTTP
jgi:glycosyltransferase involved in cell wall biosynthesis